MLIFSKPRFIFFLGDHTDTLPVQSISQNISYFIGIPVSYTVSEIFFRLVNQFGLSKELEYFQQLYKAHLRT